MRRTEGQPLFRSRQCKAREGKNDIWSVITPRVMAIGFHVSPGVCTQKMTWLGRALQVNLQGRQGSGRGGKKMTAISKQIFWGVDFTCHFKLWACSWKPREDFLFILFLGIQFAFHISWMTWIILNAHCPRLWRNSYEILWAPVAEHSLLPLVFHSTAFISNDHISWDSSS